MPGLKRHFRFRIMSCATTICLFIYIFINYNDQSYQHTPSNVSGVSTDDHNEQLENLANDIDYIETHQIPQLPLERLMKLKIYQPAFKINNTCIISTPSLFDIAYNNYYWQVCALPSGASIYLYGAYYDNKTATNPVIRITVMVDRIKPPNVYCQLWEEDIHSGPVFSPAFFGLLWNAHWGDYKDGYLLPYLVTCLIPSQSSAKTFKTVSVVENVCQKVTNNLKIFDKQQKYTNPSFAVCVKGLAFLHKDLSFRLIEWIELLKLLGVSKIHFYELAVHPNVAKVLRYYKKQGIVETSKLSYPGNQPNFPELIELYQQDRMITKRQSEVIPYNDCYNRNKLSHDFVALLDVDEIILPTHPTMRTWQDMFLTFNVSDRDAICVQNVYFFDKWKTENEIQIPSHLHMLSHVVRSANYSEPTEYVKCFHNTSTVTAVHNHFPMSCLKNGSVIPCHFHTLKPDIAHLQHYRKDCTIHLKGDCDEYQTYRYYDKTIYRYKDDLIQNTNIVLKLLAML